MAPTVHCIRHAQGYHNLSIENHIIPDPLLTPFGEQQCHRLARQFHRQANVDLIVASPLRRTLYTALLSLAPALSRENPPKFIALPEAQETADVPCDTGSDREVLEREFAGKGIDFSLVCDGWNVKTGKWAPSPEALRARARDVRRWLRERPEKEIVLVTHGGFLHYLTEDWSDFNHYNGTGWANTEGRSYVFKPVTLGDPDAPMLETASSKAARLARSERLPSPPSSSPSSPHHEQLETHRSHDSNASLRSNGSVVSFAGADKKPHGLRKPGDRDAGGYAFKSKV